MTIYVMKVSCPARSGIVAAVSGYLARSGCNINDSSQFTDQETGRFFMRLSFVSNRGWSVTPSLKASLRSLPISTWTTISMISPAKPRR